MTEPWPLTASELDAIDAWWRAANYLSVGQIYLLGNPLLAEPLRPEHVKPRLLGHWGTTPGLNLIYAHLNRVIRNQDLNVIYVCGPGHGGPGMVANPHPDGTYSAPYPPLTPAADGAVLPILHLNGYKIANPAVLARIPAAELESLLRGYGYAPYTVEGEDPKLVHQELAATMDRVIGEIRAIQRRAREEGD